jgi:CBS domain-containing protein
MLADAGQRAATDPVVLTIRELIGYWGARGRGSRVVAQIHRDLARAGLQTDPGFEGGYIDNSIRLVPARDAVAQGEPVAEGNEAFLRVDSLKCATQGLEMVPLDAPISNAMTVMALKDYSQLAVGSTPRSVRGAVTWESIGRRRLVGNVTRVGDALAEATVVATSDDLLPVLPQVATAGFVFVQDDTRSMVGIVTAADVTNEFGALAEPFFLLGEIERRLRLCLRNAQFDVAAYESVRIEDDPTREVLGPEDLTLGEVERLLENSDNWEKLGWQVDRKIFLARLAEVRDIRNSLMHFASDVPSGDDKTAMRNLLALLKIAGAA